MASPRASTSESELIAVPSLPDKSIIGHSFSIDNLLKYDQNHISHIPRSQNMNFRLELTPKQICPMPPNVFVSPNLFQKKSPRRILHDTSDVTDLSITSIQGEVFDDSDTTIDGDMSNSAPTCEGDEHASLAPDDETTLHKKKRARTAFSIYQIKILEAEYQKGRYLNGNKRKELSKFLKLTETQIKIWFQNRRTKHKRQQVSEMETWAQQFYSPLGSMAPRPLVIGDRLYLFNNPGTDAPPSSHYGPMPFIFNKW